MPAQPSPSGNESILETRNPSNIFRSLTAVTGLVKSSAGATTHCVSVCIADGVSGVRGREIRPEILVN